MAYTILSFFHYMAYLSFFTINGIYHYNDNDAKKIGCRFGYAVIFYTTDPGFHGRLWDMNGIFSWDKWRLIVGYFHGIYRFNGIF